MKLIRLSFFKYTRISDEDYGRVSYAPWWEHVDRDTDRSYAYTYHYYTDKSGNRQRRKIYLHRLITNCPPHYVVDHRDRDGLNNQRWNLRISTHSQNRTNSPHHTDNLTGFKGVSLSSSRNTWRARIHYQGVDYELGRYATAEEAALAYDAKARELFGIYAWQNFSPLFENEVQRRQEESQNHLEDVPF
ncbi:unnamed protein product [Sphagnum jensenii]|uniref:AP2/ERF domain-containing protein n=1 Tax=Sphagnum jensenii TaxID=128206 RepID=A0ABP0VJY9_9BRYO